MRLAPGRLPLAAAAAALALALAGPGPAAAKKRKTYYFMLTDIQLSDGVPAAVGEQARAQFLAEFAGRDQIITELPAGAPDPEAEPDKFQKFLDKRNIAAYKVNVEITRYEREIEPGDDTRPNRLRVHISLRMFGETYPGRGMGFAGAGAATIKLDVGKTVRPREDEVANRNALEIACADAVDTSLAKLDLPPPSDAKKKKRKK